MRAHSGTFSVWRATQDISTALASPAGRRSVGIILIVDVGPVGLASRGSLKVATSRPPCAAGAACLRTAAAAIRCHGRSRPFARRRPDGAPVASGRCARRRRCRMAACGRQRARGASSPMARRSRWVPVGSGRRGVASDGARGPRGRLRMRSPAVPPSRACRWVPGHRPRPGATTSVTAAVAGRCLGCRLGCHQRFRRLLASFVPRGSSISAPLAVVVALAVAVAALPLLPLGAGAPPPRRSAL